MLVLALPQTAARLMRIRAAVNAVMVVVDTEGVVKDASRTNMSATKKVEQ